MVRLKHKAKHRATKNVMATIRTEWLCLVNWLRYFALKDSRILAKVRRIFF